MPRSVQLTLAALAAALTVAAQQHPEVHFNRDIRPILSENCYACHGPDEAQRMTALRLDTENGAFSEASSGRMVIESGRPDASELFLRISTPDAARRMPPSAMGHDPLPADAVEKIRAWIGQGARWQGHWAFVAPRRPTVPTVRHPEWPVNAIDSFVLRRLRDEGLEPAPPAARETLIRRVTFDLTGAPPRLADVDAFLADESPGAYEAVVDRLLSSPGYGERLAIRWLDAARYADTNGYQTDAERSMWRWRDWVISAFAANQPFDEFTVEQLAGDMLPGATLQQVIATGFNRNHRGNGEGGIVDAEYAVEYVVDRVDTTSTVWLGLTVGCARCHDHKYDPITQKEYYELFAYFNNVPEKGKAFKYGNSPPFVKAPTPEQERRLAEMDATLANLRKEYSLLAESESAARSAWERETAKSGLDWFDARGLVATFPEREAGAAPRDHTFQGGDVADLGDQADFSFYGRFSAAGWIHSASPDGAIVSRTGNVAPEDDTQGNPGWGLYLKAGKLQVNLVNRWLDDCLRLESKEPLALGTWHHVGFTYDGTRLASGVKVYVDGKPVDLKVIRDEMNQEIRSKEPLRVGGGLGLEFRGAIRGLMIYRRELSASEMAVAAVEATAADIAGLPAASRRPGESDKLDRAYRNVLGPQRITSLTARIRDLAAKRQAYWDAVPSVMVMREMIPRRKTHLLHRGAYDAPAEQVSPGLPSTLSPSDPRSRLDFARWLVSKDNPLTARVMVNRLWQMLWGTGIVATVEDFGAQGEWPTHPDLLDWLAVEFMDSGWDIKALLKNVVLSATYRQSSRARPELAARDPRNRLLARGSRLRLPAETVRDLSLAVSGLLVGKVGGPSVSPYQPPGLWTELAGGKDYELGQGEDLYRRSLYTFWKRAVPPPSMMLFDSAGREACTVRSVRTNTPLQALNRMNDAAYLEAAEALAARVRRMSGPEPSARLGQMFRLITAREPTEDEAAVLASGFSYQLDRFQGDLKAAAALLGADDTPQSGPQADPELAAYTMMASLLLNLDEAITRE